MNIFILSTDPAIAASYHCDQHLHKMILESAQILSTVVHTKSPSFDNSLYYKPTHANHPCTLWARQSVANAYWIVKLARELDKIRMSLGSSSHKSMKVIEQFAVDYVLDEFPPGEPESFIFCGPEYIKKQSNLTISEQYQEYYRYKALTWTTKMTWKNRQVPAFMEVQS